MAFGHHRAQTGNFVPQKNVSSEARARLEVAYNVSWSTPRNKKVGKGNKTNIDSFNLPIGL